jgi:crotonobetaine/carnitine-CoA ligase
MSGTGAMGSDQPESRILPLIVKRQAERRPEAGFLEDHRRAYTPAEVHEAALVWARAFDRCGVRPGDRVLLMLPVSVESVFAWLGLGWIGAVETPINYEYKGAMLDYVMRDSGARLLVVHPQYLAQIATAVDGLPGIQQVVIAGEERTRPHAFAHPAVVELDDFLRVDGPLPAESVLSESHIGTVIYTSGTTGPSKGVMVPWAQLEATARWTIPLDSLGERDAYYNPYPLFHIAGKISVYTMAMVGGRTVLRERFSTAEFWSDVNRFGCTVAILLGAVANFLYRQPERSGDRDNCLEKALMVPLIPEVERFKERFGLRVCTCWNMTETSTPIVSPGFDLVDAASCGRARPGVTCRLVDEEDRAVPRGQAGELAVRTDEPWTMMAGYLGKPDRTIDATRNLWLHTGDVFRQDEVGNFYYVDRKKDMIRRRGENISSVEVELEVYSFPGVLECAAYGVPSEWGEEEVMVSVLPKPGHGFDLDALHRHLVQRLPRFMVPRYLRIVDRMPKTPTAKIRKQDLREAGVTADTFRPSRDEPRRAL